MLNALLEESEKEERGSDVEGSADDLLGGSSAGGSGGSSVGGADYLHGVDEAVRVGNASSRSRAGDGRARRAGAVRAELGLGRLVDVAVSLEPKGRST